MKRNWDKVINKVSGALRLFVARFVKRDQKQISARLDVLLLEKAREQGIEVVLKKKLSPLTLVAWFMSASVAVASLAAVVLLVPGPWTRFFANPQIVTMSMTGLEVGVNGVSDLRPKITIQSPKTVRGVQFVKANLSMSPNVPVEIELVAESGDIVVTPQEDLQKGQVYTLSLAPGIPFTDGTYLANEQSWVIPIKAVFDVVSISPRDNSSVSSNATVEISFTTDEFTLEDVTSAVQIFPEVAGSFQKIDSRLVFAPKNGLTIGASYTVTVLTGAKNRQGEQIPKEYSATFKVEYGGTSVWPSGVTSPSISTEFRIYNVTNGGDTIMFGSDKIPKVLVTVYTVDWAEVSPEVNEYMRKGTFNPVKLVDDKKSVLTKPINGARIQGTTEYAYTQSFADLKPGMYVVKIASTDRGSIGVATYMLLFKGNIGAYATTRENKTDLDIWAFDYGTNKPLESVSFEVVHCEKSGCSSVQSQTGKDGYARVKSNKSVSYVVASHAGSVQILFPELSYSTGGGFAGYSNADRASYSKIITNKPAYLPGSTVKFTALLRERVGSEYKKIPKGKIYNVYLCPSFVDVDRSNAKSMEASCLYSKYLPVDENSQIDYSFPIWKRPENLDLLIMEERNGELIYVDEANLWVGELDKPQTRIEAKANKLRYVGSDSVVVSGRVLDYVDAGIPGKKVTVSATVNMLDTDNITLEVGETVVQTDQKGNFTAKIKLPVSEMQAFEGKLQFSAKMLDGEDELSTTFEASWDKGERIIPSILLNNKAIDFNVPTGSTPVVIFSAETLPKRDPKKGKKFTATVTRHYEVPILLPPEYDPETREMVSQESFESKTEEVLVTQLTTNEKGNVSLKIPAVKEGTYRVVITDNEGTWKVAEDRLLFYVGASDWSEEINAINEWVYSVNFDGERAAVGDKVKFSINSSFKKSKQELVLFTRTTEVTNWQYISQNTTSVDIPITKEMAGGVEVCVLHPMKAYKKGKDGKAQFIGGAMRLACDQLVVENKNKKLNLKLDPEAKEIKPGAVSNLGVEVANVLGAGESATVGITVVDKALYDAYDNQEYVEDSVYLNLYEDFFGQFANAADHGIVSIDAEELIVGSGGQGGAGDGNVSSMRKDFSDNPYWKAVLKTDANGRLTVPITYSDGLTTWVITVWAVTDDFSIGSTVLEVKTHKPVYIDVDRPSRLHLGDSWYPYVRVTNAQNTTFNGTVSITCEGCLDKVTSFEVKLKPYETFEQLLQAKLTKSENVTLRAEVKQGSTLVDGLEYPIDVRAIGFEVPFMVQKAMTKKENTIGFQIPDGAAPLLSTVKVDISALPLVVDDALFVGTGNAKTIELAGAIANLGTLARFNSFSEDNTLEDSQVTARMYVADLLQRILPNGSFSFHTYGGTDYQSTIAAAYALAEVNQGFSGKVSIDEVVLVQVAEYLRTAIQSDKVPLKEKVEFAYVYARLEKKQAAALVTNLAKSVEKTELTKTERAYLALSLYQVGSTAEATKLVLAQEKANASEVVSGAYVSGDVSEVTTAIQAYLLSKLGIWVQQKATLEQYQDWLLNSCVTCLGAFDRSLVSALLTGSLLPEQEGSSAKEMLRLEVNGNVVPVATEYNGGRLSVTVPAIRLKSGNNTVSVTSPSGRRFFVAVQGSIYHTKLPESTEVAKAALNVVRFGITPASQGGTINAGASGFVSVKVTALEDIPLSKLAIYLPSGLSAEIGTYPDAFLQYVHDNDAAYAYGDFARGDAYTAEIQPLKKGESQVVVLPFIAKRLGAFNGELVQFSIPSANGSMVVVKGSSVHVK